MLLRVESDAVSDYQSLVHEIDEVSKSKIHEESDQIVNEGCLLNCFHQELLHLESR